MRDAADLDDHRFARTDGRSLAQRRSSEDRTGAALEAALLSERRLPTRNLQRHARRHTAARRAAIDLAAREDADVAAGRHRTVGQDGAIEKSEIGLGGMLDRNGLG